MLRGHGIGDAATLAKRGLEELRCGSQSRAKPLAASRHQEIRHTSGESFAGGNMKKNAIRVVARGLIVAGAVTAVTAVAAVTAVTAVTAQNRQDFVRITPAQIHWQEIPNAHGAQQAILLGDPAKPGMYVIRVRFPPHVMDLPHWHSMARYVTVLEGDWVTGTGDTFDLARTVHLKPGSVMLHPARAVHWDGSGGAEPVIVQIIGEGPATTTPVDATKPFWIEVAH